MKIEECWYLGNCNNECSNSCIRFNIMKSLCEQSNLPITMWKQNKLYSKIDEDAFNDLKYLQKNVDKLVNKGNNVLIYSSGCGNGKTSWAIKLLLSYFNKIWHIAGFNCKGLFLNVNSFLNDTKRNINNPSRDYDKLLENIKSVPLVIWDDMGSNTISDYDSSLLFDLLNHRMSNNFSNIYTSNCALQNLENTLNPRLYSRVVDGSLVIEFNGKDMRGERYNG